MNFPLFYQGSQEDFSESHARLWGERGSQFGLFVLPLTFEFDGLRRRRGAFFGQSETERESALTASAKNRQHIYSTQHTFFTQCSIWPVLHVTEGQLLRKKKILAPLGQISKERWLVKGGGGCFPSPLRGRKRKENSPAGKTTKKNKALKHIAPPTSCSG